MNKLLIILTLFTSTQLLAEEYICQGVIQTWQKTKNSTSNEFKVIANKPTTYVSKSFLGKHNYASIDGSWLSFPLVIIGNKLSYTIEANVQFYDGVRHVVKVYNRTITDRNKKGLLAVSNLSNKTDESASKTITGYTALDVMGKGYTFKDKEITVNSNPHFFEVTQVETKGGCQLKK